MQDDLPGVGGGRQHAVAAHHQHHVAQRDFRVDGGAWTPMKRVLQSDPALVAENARDDEARTR